MRVLNFPYREANVKISTKFNHSVPHYILNSELNQMENFGIKLLSGSTNAFVTWATAIYSALSAQLCVRPHPLSRRFFSRIRELEYQ